MTGLASALPVEPASPSAFTIKITWDSSVAAAPSGFTSDVLAAVRYLETEFSDPVTVNIHVGYGEVGGSSLGGNALGESESFLSDVTYANLRAAVIKDTTTPTDASVVASLPGSSPVNGANYWVTTAEAKALGLVPANGTSLDGDVGFAPASEFTYGDTAAGGKVTPGTYDFFATVVHEITEVMGRQMLTGATFDGSPNSYTLLDLLHYSAPGRRDFTQSTPGYFSVNGGATNLGEFNTLPSGDSGDWALSEPGDPFDAFSYPGIAEPVSSDDLAEMDALGWNPAGAIGTTPFVPANVTIPSVPSGPSTPVSPPISPLVPVNDPVVQMPIPAGATGIGFAPEPPYLAIAQGCGDLPAGTPLATVADVGGTAGDKFSYALTGAGAGSFALIPTNNAALLMVGAQDLAGAAEGALYPMAVTATDETKVGNPTSNGLVNVVVGDNGKDTINLASLPGIVASAPTFIYGLGGEATVDGTGMTGTLYFDGGTGADTLTGGNGVNVYEFGDGTGNRTALDVITNFVASVDLIDLTWVGWRFSGAAALGGSATTIAPDSVGWQSSGGNTFVYVNTGGWTEALSAADMKIELQGNIALTAANFTHG